MHYYKSSFFLLFYENCDNTLQFEKHMEKKSDLISIYNFTYFASKNDYGHIYVLHVEITQYIFTNSNFFHFCVTI